MCSTFEPMPSIFAPSATRKRQRSWTCGSQAAFEIIVFPGVIEAAMTAFSVAITDASSMWMCAPGERARSARNGPGTRTSRRAPRRHGCAGRACAGRSRHRPEAARVARPTRASSGPASRNDARIWLASDASTSSADVAGVHAHFVRRRSTRHRRRGCESRSSIVSTSRMRGMFVSDDGLVGEQAGGEDRQRAVLVAGRAHPSRDRMTAFDHERLCERA